MVARLDRVLQGLPQTDVSSSRTGASKGPHGEDRAGCQKEASPRRPCVDTPPTTTQGRPILPPRPPQASGLGHQVKTSGTGPLTQGRAAEVASSQGGGCRRSASPEGHQEGRVE